MSIFFSPMKLIIMTFSQYVLMSQVRTDERNKNLFNKLAPLVQSVDKNVCLFNIFPCSNNVCECYFQCYQHLNSNLFHLLKKYLSLLSYQSLFQEHICKVTFSIHFYLTAI